MPINITYRSQQWPVGHGFFHTASLKADADTRTYRYVYDCGSAARTLVEERIKSYSQNEDMEVREPVLDMLVLSHFHIDHINGVPHLLTLFKVKKLVLPFLSDDFVLAALADLAANGPAVWNEFSGLVLDPQAWMQNLGHGDTEITRIGPGGPEGRLDGVQNGDISLPAGQISHHVTGTIGAAGDEYWDFRFYAHENWERYFSLLGALNEKFNPATEQDLLTWLSDPAWILANHSTVSEVFRSLGSPNQNGISLCMYSGPRRGRHADGNGYVRGAIHEPVWLHPEDEWPWTRQLGWLGTGDAELRDPALFHAFSMHYQDYSHAVNTLTIPHHGSIENYCAALGEIGQAAVLTSDHVNDPDGHHPSTLVMINLRTKCKRIFIVTRDMGSAVFSSTTVFVR